MTMKLNSLARWASLPSTDAIVFEGSDVAERRVRINFNLEAVTAFYIGGEGVESFLCTIGPGLETVEFNVAGSFRVYAEEGSAAVLYQSADLEPTFHEVVDPVIFTKIANRRQRNPELEEIMYQMQVNVERRLAAQANEIEAAYARRLEEFQNVRSAEAVVAGTTPVAGEPQVPAQVAAGEKPGETAGTPPSSEPAGGSSGG